MIRKSIAPPPRTGGLEVINQGGEIERRMDTHHKMDMIGLPAK